MAGCQILPSNFETQVLGALDASSEYVEIELSFGSYSNTEYTSSISTDAFRRLQEIYNTQNIPVQRETSQVKIESLKQDKVSLREQNVNNVETYQEKRVQKRVNVPEYSARIRISEEKALPRRPEKFKPTLVRKRTRWSYAVSEFFSLDLTYVETGVDRKRITYEAELELNGEKLRQERASITSILTSFNSFACDLRRYITNTHILYTEGEKNDMYNNFRYILTGDTNGKIDYSVKTQVRNLHYVDLVYGGLVGNMETGYSPVKDKYFTGGRREQVTPYTVTHKADGMRFFLFVYKRNLWLLNPGVMYIKVYGSSVFPDVQEDFFTRNAGTILEGELIPEGSEFRIGQGAPSEKYWFIAYDILAKGGDKSVQKLPHMNDVPQTGSRFRFAKAFTETFTQELTDMDISMQTKDFRNFALRDNGNILVEDSPEVFFQTLERMFKEQENSVPPYKTDGFIFTPALTPYNLNQHKAPLQDRRLTQIPDICKWKFAKQITTDYAIQWNVDKTVLQLQVLHSWQKDTLIPFEGTDRYPLTSDLFDNTTLDKVRKYNTGDILEFGIVAGKMVFEKPRPDKPVPNKEEIAKDNWELAHDPISKDTLAGKDMVLFRKYHNKVKRSLYKTLPKETVLLDIGSGRGGDVLEWKKFEKVIAVEPNPEFRQELLRRVTENNLQDKVRILPIGGEESETISREVYDFARGGADVVSFMFSLSYFWKSLDTFSQLMETIRKSLKSGGKIIFATIDGDLTEQMFLPVLMGPSSALPKRPAYFTDTGFKLGTLATLNYIQPERKLYTHLPLSETAQDIEEWPPFLDDVNLELGSHFEKYLRLDAEKFLPPGQTILSRFYSGGIIHVPKTTEMPVEKISFPAPQVFLPPPTVEGAIVSSIQPVFEVAEVISQKDVVQKVSTQKKEGIQPQKVLRPPETQLTGTAPGDDKTQILLTKKYRYPVHRIACITPDSFFHALLKSFYPPYQENSSYTKRNDIVANYRSALALAASNFYANSEAEKIHAEQEQLLRNGTVTRKGGEITNIETGEAEPDMSLKNVEEMLRSNGTNDLLFDIIARATGISIMIVDYDEEISDLRVYLNIAVSTRYCILLYIDGYYELLAANNSGLQTTFPVSSSFVINLLK